MRLMDMDFLDELRDVSKYVCAKYRPTLKSMGMDREDVVGEIALKMVRNSVEFNPEKSSLRRFLTVVVERYCIEVIKSSKAQKRPFLLFYGLSSSERFAGMALEQEETVFKDLLFEDLMDTVVEEESRKVGRLDLTEMIRMMAEGYKKKDIAEMFGVSTNTITFYLHKAEKLKGVVLN